MNQIRNGRSPTLLACPSGVRYGIVVLGINDNRVVDMHLVKPIDPLQPHIEAELEAIPDWRFDNEYVYLGRERDE